MRIEKVKIGEVKPNKENPRTIKDDKFIKLTNSIRSFPEMLEARPIVVDDDMIVLGGNMRLKACKEAGLKEVYIIKFDNLSDDKKKEFIIKDNVGYGEWDWDILNTEYEEEDLLDWGLEPKKDKEIEEIDGLVDINYINVSLDNIDKQKTLFNELKAIGYKDKDIKMLNFSISDKPKKDRVVDKSYIKEINKKYEFNIDRVNEVNESFNTKFILDKFDMEIVQKESFTGEIDLDFDWNVGLIVGNSGTGKSTISKELFGNDYITEYKYDDKAIIDNFGDINIEDIINILTSVGLASTKTWLKPYHVLSGGEKMRCDLARAIISERELVVFDEFTSVVDRDIAKIGSFITQKNIRRNNKKFIAVGCHFDVEDWLLPDWVLNTNDMSFYVNKDIKKKSDHLSILKLEKLKVKIRPKLGISLKNIII